MTNHGLTATENPKGSKITIISYLLKSSEHTHYWFNERHEFQFPSTTLDQKASNQPSVREIQLVTTTNKRLKSGNIDHENFHILKDEQRTESLSDSSKALLIADRTSLP